VRALRTARALSPDEQVALLAAYVPAHDSPEPYLAALADMQGATRDGVFALLQLAMRTGHLGDEARDLILEYVRAEAEAGGHELPAIELVELWVDNLAPPLDAVTTSVKALLEDKEKFARLLPFVMKLVRGQDGFPDAEGALRHLIAQVREHYASAPIRPKPVRATR
jgi:hypothetical protein